MTHFLLGAICAFLTTIVSGHREHKVHNIVLYPEKHSWCKTTPIKQVVGHPGCAQIEVDNNVCVGACFSYSIPRTEPTAPGEVLPYCDSCQPSSVSWKHVKLVCEGEITEMTKKVEVIEDCSCLTCPSPPPQPTRPGEEGGSPADVPQLLGLLHRANSSSHSNLKHSERLSLLVKMLSEEGERMGEVHDFISQVTGDDNAAPEGSQEEEDQVKLDLGKLRAYLSKIDTSHHHHRHHQHTKKDEEELQPTLDVLSHHLRPALEGEEITYLADHKTESDTNTQPPEQT